MSTTAISTAPTAPERQATTPAERRVPVVYTGRPVALATAHRKAEVLADVFATAGLHLLEVPVETDRLGTFTGEVAREAGLFETAVAKARLGAATSALALNAASEGSFAADPTSGIVVQREVVAWVDEETELVVVGRSGGYAPWVRSWTLATGEDPAPLVSDLDLTSHRLVVRPEPSPGRGDEQGGAGAITKGVEDLASLRAAVERAAGPSGRVRIETDLRSHVCPMRHRVMREAALDLLLRLHTPCPLCHRPGFGPEEATGGARCRECDAPTSVRSHAVDRCPSCGHAQARPTGPATADPARCPECNP